MKSLAVLVLLVLATPVNAGPFTILRGGVAGMSPDTETPTILLNGETGQTFMLAYVHGAGFRWLPLPFGHPPSPLPPVLSPDVSP